MSSIALKSRRSGFSLVELVIVVVIIGIIGAIAIPRLSRGSANAGENALRANLSVLRKAIELYAAEHEGNFPGQGTDDINLQLTQYTNLAGATSATYNAGTGFVYGPYLQAIPTITVGSDRTARTIATSAGSGVAWIYTPATGNIRANAPAPYDSW